MWSNWSSLARAGVAVVAVSTAGVLAGCGDSGTSPSETGSAQAYVQDDPSAGGQGSHMAARDGHSAGQATYSGTLDAQAQVAISADGSSWVELGSPSSVSVQLQATGDGADVHGQVSVPVGTYTRVRLVLSGAEANLTAGSTIGGISLDASASVTVGTNGSVVIEKQVPPFEVRADTHTRIYWNMNSHLWMNEETVEDEEVEDEEVEEAAEPRTESGSSDEIH